MTYTPDKEELEKQLATMTQRGALGRSNTLSNLLEYLINKEVLRLEQGPIAIPYPKELEIAIDAFGKSVDFNSAEDSSIRVNISRLRKKLEDYYLDEGKDDSIHIDIPVGEYRLTFKKKAHTAIPDETNTQTTIKNFSLHPILFACILVVCVVSLAINARFMFTSNKNTPLIKSDNIGLIWQDYLKGERKNIFVLGSKPTESVSSHLFNRNLVMSLKNIASLSENARYARIKYSYELSVDELKHRNIIYLGHYEDMALLKNYFKGSTLTFSSEKDTLKRINLDTECTSPNDLKDQYIDYGLFAKIDGPRGNKIYIISGFSDSALLRISWFLTTATPTNITGLDKYINEFKFTDTDNFEMLFKIQSMNHSDLSHELISISPVDNRAIWSTFE